MSRISEWYSQADVIAKWIVFRGAGRIKGQTHSARVPDSHSNTPGFKRIQAACAEAVCGCRPGHTRTAGCAVGVTGHRAGTEAPLVRLQKRWTRETYLQRLSM